MCGIAGIFTLNKELHPSWIKQMTDSIVHRGPDAGGTYTTENKQLALEVRFLK